MNTQKNRRRYVVNREETKTKESKAIDETKSKNKPTSKKKNKD